MTADHSDAPSSIPAKPAPGRASASSPNPPANAAPALMEAAFKAQNKKATKRGGCRPLSDEERTIIDAYMADPRNEVPFADRLLLCVLLELGLRADEARCLTFGMFIKDGDWVRDIFIPGELCKGRYAPDRWKRISPPTLKLLRQHADDALRHNKWGLDRFVFFSPKRHSAKPVSYSTVRSHLRKIFVGALKNPDRVATHTPRKTLATALWRATGDIFLVKRVLGHRSLISTIKYIELSDQEANDAIERERAGHYKGGAATRERLRAMVKLGQTFLDFPDEFQPGAESTPVTNLPLTAEERARRSSTLAIAAALMEREASRQRLFAKRQKGRLAQAPPDPAAREAALAAVCG